MKKSRKTRTFGLLTVLVAFVVSSVFITAYNVQAEDSTKVVKEESKKAETKDKEAKDKKDSKAVKGSDKKGKYFFKKTCKSCHGKKGDAEEITPLSKTIKQWERYFKKDKHNEKAISEEFEAEQIIHIKTFLINHAADSDQPETCG